MDGCRNGCGAKLKYDLTVLSMEKPVLRKLILISALCMASAPAWADADAVLASPLPAPGVAGLIAVGVIGAILVARRRK